jgi:hypothetical protein
VCPGPARSELPRLPCPHERRTPVRRAHAPLDDMTRVGRWSRRSGACRKVATLCYFAASNRSQACLPPAAVASARQSRIAGRGRQPRDSLLCRHRDATICSLWRIDAVIGWGRPSRCLRINGGQIVLTAVSVALRFAYSCKVVMSWGARIGRKATSCWRIMCSSVLPYKSERAVDAAQSFKGN